jgi:glycosyltransferase involved in cell wall biosynthesis
VSGLLRVGFDARWYNGSGVGTYVAEMLRALTGLREELEFVIYEDRKNPVPARLGERVVRVPVRSSKYSLAGQFELREHVKSVKLDLFHSPFYAAPLLLSCPLVVTIHDLIPFLFRISAWPKQTLIKAGYRIAALRARHIITDSLNTASDVARILKITPSRITSVHCASSPDSFHSRRDPAELANLVEKYGVRPPYAVVASAVNWRTKNLESAFQALALGRRNSGIDFQAVVYGPEDGLRVLSARPRAFALNVHYVGYLPANDLGALFRNAQLFIMPSLYEGFGLPVLDAMACGCPVVTSNAGSLAEVAGSGAQTFAPSDVEGMAEAVARLLTCPEEVRKWKGLASRRAAEFSWERAAEDTAAVYRKVCHDSHRRRGGLSSDSN